MVRPTRRRSLMVLLASVLVLALASCTPDPRPTEIESFEATPASVLRGDAVTLSWAATGVGQHPSAPSCSMARRVEGEEPGPAFGVACAGSLTEVPPVSESASYVRYQLSVLKNPYDADDSYLTSVVTVEIEDAPDVVSVSIDQADLDLLVGEGDTLTAAVVVQGTASAAVTWSSSDEGVATVEPDTGVVAAVGEGDADITATSVFDDSKADSIPVRVRYGPFGGLTTLADARGPRGRDSVAADGSRVLVSRAGGLRGNVDVYARGGDGTWAIDATLFVPWDGDFGAFGGSVDLSGDTAVVSDSQLVATSPDVYESLVRVYMRAPTGTWSERALLLDGLGASYTDVAIGGGVVVVGLPSRGLGGESSVRVYEQDQGGTNAWGLAAVIPVPPSLVGDSADAFATDVDVSQDGDRIVVVSSTTDWDECRGEAVFIYERSATDPSGWANVDVIEGADIRFPGTCTAFAAIDGDVVAITGTPASVARVQIFERGADGTDAWSEVRFHEFDVPRNPDDGLMLGQISLSVRGTTAVLGFAGDRCDGLAPCAPGEVRVLNRDVGGVGAWGVSGTFTPDPGYADQGFGASVDVSSDGRVVIVGTNPGSSADPSTSGEAYVTER
jgi:hypothetical protein